MTNNEKNVDENNEINEEVTGADTTQDENQEEETDKVSLTKEELEELREAEERLKVAEEKANRYKSERDRLKSKKKDTKTSESLLEKAFLNSAGYTDSEEQEEIQKMASNMGLSVDEAVADDFVKSRIESLRKQKEVANATPSNSKRKGSTKDDVSYWIDKGELPPNTPENRQLRRDVVNARYKGSKSSNKFNN
jgi:hypothetical protein